MRLTFCGHSEYIPSPGSKQRLLDFLAELIGDRSAEILLGGYGFFDSFAYTCAKDYRRAHPRVQLVLVSPYPHGRCRSSSPLGEDYDSTVYPPLEAAPPRLAIIKRNEWMVKEADVLIAHVRHRFGGAYRTLCYAEKLGKRIVLFEEK